MVSETAMFEWSYNIITVIIGAHAFSFRWLIIVDLFSFFVENNLNKEKYKFYLVQSHRLDQPGLILYIGPGQMIDIGPGPMYYMGLAYYWQVGGGQIN